MRPSGLAVLLGWIGADSVTCPPQLVIRRVFRAGRGLCCAHLSTSIHGEIMAILVRALSVLVVLLTALLAGAPAGGAHAVLESSNPADGASVRAAPRRVTLTFGEAVDAGFAKVTVLGPDGRSHWEAGPARGIGERVTAPLRELGPAGRYVIEYRVLSADGHPVSGSVSFRLKVAGDGTPAAGGGTAAGAPPTQGGVPLWVWIVGTVVLFVAAMLAAAFATRPPRDR